MVRQDAVGDLLQEDGLAGPRRRDDHAALAEADGSDQVHDPHVDLVVVGLEPDPTLGVQRGQVVEADFLAQLVGVFKVDGLDAQQGEVALVLLGRPDLAGNDRPGLQSEAADLAGRDINVVGAGEIVVVGAAQEAEAVGQDLERSLAVHQAVLLDPLLEDLEDQVLLLEPHVIGDALGLGRADELGHRHLLKLGEVNFTALDIFVAVMNRGVAEDIFVLDVGELLAGFRRSRRRCRGAFDPTWGREFSFAGGERPVSLEAVAMVGRCFEFSASFTIADHRRGAAFTITIAITIATDGNALVVDGAGIALGPVASQPLADGISGLTFGPLAHGFALADVSDRLAIGGALLAIGLTRRALAVGRLGGRGLSCSGAE